LSGLAIVLIALTTCQHCYVMLYLNFFYLSMAKPIWNHKGRM